MKFRKLIGPLFILIALPCACGVAADGGLFPDEIVSMETLHLQMSKNAHLLVLDARSLQSFEQAHIKGAALPLSSEYYRQETLFKEGLVKELPNTDKALEEGMARYSKDAPIVAYCNDQCEASTVLLYKLKKLGFSNAKVMKPGFQSWKAKGYPVAELSLPSGHDILIRMDENLSMRILKSLKQDSDMASRALNLKVTSKNGAVVLSGVVNDAAERELVKRKVSAVDGVKSVENKIRVKRSDKELLA